jgi:hypothetical protein
MVEGALAGIGDPRRAVAAAAELARAAIGSAWLLTLLADRVRAGGYDGDLWADVERDLRNSR